MKVFSMFSGIGGFELGTVMASKDIEFVGYSEIDKYAIQIYEKHFSGVYNYGNATRINPRELPDFDILVGGFPCQAFSVAGKRRGFNDTRGTLFFDIARICSEKRPRYLVLENVKGLLSHDNGKTFQTILGVLSDMGYGVEWQVLNSKNYGVPQNRERVFIVGHLGNSGPRKVFPITGTNPENDIKRFGHLGYGGQKGDILEVDGLSTSLTATDYKQPKQIKLVDIINKKGNSKNKNIASTISGGAHSGGNHSDMDLLITPVITPDREKKRQDGRRFKEPGDPSHTLTGQDIHGVMLNEITKGQSQGNRIYDSSGLATTLASQAGGLGAKTGLYKVDKPKILDASHRNEGNGMRIRRLTPTECERLQGFPDGWTEGLSDTQRYKTLGNAVTTTVVKAVMERLLC